MITGEGRPLLVSSAQGAGGGRWVPVGQLATRLVTPVLTPQWCFYLSGGEGQDLKCL